MIEFSKKIASFFLRAANSSSEATTLKERYKQFRISLFIAITIIALIPSTLLAIFGYFQYLNLAQKQTTTHIQWHLKYVKDAFENHIKVLSSQLSSATDRLALHNFEQQPITDAIQQHMSNEVNNLIKIEFVDEQNHPLISSLPASALPKSDLPYLIQQASTKGYALSDMQINDQKVPYFTFIIRPTPEESERNLFLVAYFNGLSLENLIQQTNASAMEDVFIINTDNVLQTTSIFFGKSQQHFPFTTSKDKINITTTRKSWGMGDIFYATTPLSGTPWILVLVKDGPVQKKDWLTFQLTLVLIFLACAMGSFFIIHQLVNLLTIRIRESDTKRMALLNEVGHTNRLATIGKLAAGVAHEINNPLAVIDQKTGLIEDLLEFTEDFTNKEKLHTSLQGIHSSVDRCKIITHRLLGFARKMDTDKERININTIVEEVMGFLEKEALYSHIFFEMQLAEDLPEIWSDKGQLQQIFLNIISNSMDAISQSGVITIQTSLKAKDKILVEINDNGPGIKPHVMEHIFDPFFTTKETGKGTGLGLSITYGLVKKLGGDIKVHSIVKEGVTFYIYLPINTSNDKESDHG